MSSLSQLDMLNRPLEEQLQIRPEIDESSLSSKSSCTTHSSFQDLKNAWEHTIVTNSPPTKSFNNGTITKQPSKLRTNLQQFAEQQSNLVTKVNNARNGRVAVGEGMRKSKRRYVPGTKSKSIISNDSYKSNLYTNTEQRYGESDSPYETTTASTTASGSHYPRTHGRRRDLARKKKKSSRNDKERKKKGDLAREFDETSGGILSKFKIPERPIEQGSSMSNTSTNSSVGTSDIGSIATASPDGEEEEQHIEEEEQTPPVPPDLDVIPSDLIEGSSLDIIPSALNEGEPSSRGVILGGDTQLVGNNTISSPSRTGLTEKLQVCNTIHDEFTSLQNEVMSLLLSDQSTVQSLNISSAKSNQLKCDICQSTTHPTLRCKVLTEDSNTNHVSVEMIQILNKLKNKLDVEQRENALYILNSNARTAGSNLPLLPPSRAPIIKKSSDISSPNERQPTDGAVCQGSSEIITEQQPPPQPSSNNVQQQPAEEIKLDKFGNEINPEKDKVALNAFLTNPSGMNWEDLVRSMKKKTGLEALVGQELVIDLNDDNVSDLDADPQEDEGSYKYTGDLSCMGNILSNYMRRKKSEGNDDGDSTLCDPLCDDTISSKDDESEVRSWGGKESNEDEAEEEPENDLVERVIACQLSPKEEVSPLRSSRQHDTLEKNIERVVLGQDQEELKHMYEQEKLDKDNPNSSTQEEDATAENKPIAPLSPPRSSSMTPRSRRTKARGGVAAKRPSITSGSSSAFSPIKSSPATPITASLETTFDSSEFSDPFKSSASFSSPQRVRSKSTPPSKFRSIEPPPPDSTEQPFSPEPISSRPQRSPRRGRSVDSRAHHNVNVAPRILSSPSVESRVDPSSEPPVLIMSMSADDERSHVDMDQPLLLGSTDKMDISAMKQESLLDEPPKIMPLADVVDEETFHQQIRGATPSLLNEKDVAVAASTANIKKKKEEEDTPSTVAPFPTSFDASEQNNNRNLSNKTSRENGKAVLLGWVDDNGNLVYGEQEKEAVSNRLKDSSGLDAAKQTLSTSLRSGTNHEEEVDDSVDGRRTPRLFILPQSLSINREKKVTCWEMAFHRIRRTKGEF